MRIILSTLVLIAFFLVGCAPLQALINTPIPTSTKTPSPTSTKTPPPTSTNTPSPTSTNTTSPTSTTTPIPEPSYLAFKEDFQSDLLDWKKSGFQSILKYSSNGIAFNFPLRTGKNKEWWCDWNFPYKVIELSGDAIIETNFDRRVRFSGLHFYHQNKTYKNKFAVIVSQGERTTWKTNEAVLGYLVNSRKNPWDNLGNIEQILKNTNGNIPLKIYFKGAKMLIYVNNRLIASREDELFDGNKYFMGLVVGNGDNFIMNSMQVRVNNLDDLKIVSVFDIPKK
ncbi:MAG: hypothetical protein MUO64_01060 [Anaerolineales bacterium]|nr:hypothetical protein [Anaerolineales bacterium]